MTLNITIKPTPSLNESLNARRDIPVFIGDSVKKYKEPLKFTDASMKVVSIDCPLDKDPVGIQVFITMYCKTTELFPISKAESGSDFIPINSNTVENINAADSFIVVLNAEKQMIGTYYVKRIIRDLELPTYIVGIQLDRAIYISPSATYFCVVTKKQVSIPGKYNKTTKLIELDYVIDNFGIGIQHQFSHIEYGILNESDYFLAIENEATGIDAVDKIRVKGFEGIGDCIVIPCNEKTTIEDIAEQLNRVRDGYYIVPVTKSEELTQKIIAAIMQSGQ